MVHDFCDTEQQGVPFQYIYIYIYVLLEHRTHSICQQVIPFQLELNYNYVVQTSYYRTNIVLSYKCRIAM